MRIMCLLVGVFLLNKANGRPVVITGVTTMGMDRVENPQRRESLGNGFYCTGARLCGSFDRCPMPSCMFRVRGDEKTTVVVGFQIEATKNVQPKVKLG